MDESMNNFLDVFHTWMQWGAILFVALGILNYVIHLIRFAGIKEFKAKIEQKKEVIDATKESIAKQEELHKHKSDELNDILSDTVKEEEILLKKSKEYGKLIDEHLIKAYNRIRSSVKNGLAVVSIERGASGGSFFTIPPQRQVEIASRKKIITDEHSGRILVDGALAEEERLKIEKLLSN